MKGIIQFSLFAVIVIGLGLVAGFYLFVSDATAPITYTIKGDIVYINDTNVIIETYPVTIQGSGYAYINLTSKSFTGNIDVAFGFNSTSAKPTSLEVYNPSTTNTTKSFTCNSPNWYNFTTSPKYFWCWRNITQTTNLVNATNNVTNSTMRIFEHSFDYATLNNNTAYWFELKNVTWVSIANLFTKVTYNYQGFDTWYISQNTPIIANTEYHTRMWLDVKPNTEGKYFVGFKPSSQTLPQAISTNTFYYIDPWFSASSINRVNVTLNVPSTTITDFNGGPYFVITPVNTTALLNTSHLISAGNMTSGCFDLEFSDISNNAVNYQWGSYANSTSLGFGCWARNTTAYANFSVSTTNATNILTANFNNVGDTTLSNATLGAGNNTPRSGVALFTFAYGSSTKIFDSNGGTLNAISRSAGARVENVGIFDSADQMPDGGGNRYVSDDETQFRHDNETSRGSTFFFVLRMGGTDGNEFISKDGVGGGWALDHNLASNIRLGCCGVNGPGVAVTNGDWYYIFVTLNSSNSIAYFYTNTSFVGTSAIVGASTNVNDPFVMGTIANGPLIDTVVVISKALTPSEINATWSRWASYSDLYTQGYIESQATVPVISAVTEPTDPATYSPGTMRNFSWDINNAEGVLVSFEHDSNITDGSFINSTNRTDGGIACTGGANSTHIRCWSQLDTPTRTIDWRVNANKSTTTWATAVSGTFVVNSNSSAGVNLFLNGTQNSDRYYRNNTIVNITARVNVTGLSVELSGNYTGYGSGSLNTLFSSFIPSSGTDVIENISIAKNYTNQIFNVTGRFLGNANYTASALQTRYVLLDVLGPQVRAFSFNDTYININQTILIEVNATSNNNESSNGLMNETFNMSQILVEINRTGGTRLNVSLTLQSNRNFTGTFSSTQLGAVQQNASIIGITNIYTNDSSNNSIINSSSLLTFDYARTILANQTDTPDPVTNSTEEFFTVSVQLASTENSRLTGATVSFEFRGANNSMAYSPSTDNHVATISSAVPAQVYNYKIYFENNSFQSQSVVGVIEVKSGVGGSETPGSGEGSSSIVPATTPEKEIITNKSIFSVSPTSPSNFLISGKTYKTIFVIDNKNEKSLSITASFVCPIIKLLNETILEPACNWFSFDTGGILSNKINVIVNPNSKFSLPVVITIPNNIEDKRREVTIIFNNTNEDFGRSVTYVLASPSDIGIGELGVKFWTADIVKFPRETLGLSSITGGTLIVSTASIGSIGGLTWFTRKTIFNSKK